jgi:hypothetical protein
MSEDQNIPEENNKEQIPISKEEGVSETISTPEIIEQIETSDIHTSDIHNMEVHHHPHVEKKNFKEYFLEFLMIFLAVTMGFIAENMRENISDREKEKELMQSLIKDLEEDSATIENQVNLAQKRLLYSDSLIELVHEGNALNKNGRFLLLRTHDRQVDIFF